MRNVCEKAIELIKRYESLQLKSYKCPAGIWTIGYGHTSNVVGPNQSITEDAALNLLKGDVLETAIRVDHNIEVEINENQFGALVCLAFNIGIGNFKESSVLKLVNDCRFDEAANSFLLWCKVKGQYSSGLHNRRIEERALFLTQI